jgi:peptide subunit release factor 1 (eRF1)
MGTASNIKSKSVRKDVQQALRSALQLLKTAPNKAPETGYVLCAGNITAEKSWV